MKLGEMDKSMKSACFEEITHLICDADKRVCFHRQYFWFWKLSLNYAKVNISDVSNNWNISHRDSETLLLEWIETNKNKSLSKEFLIRGVEKNGNCVITVCNVTTSYVALGKIIRQYNHIGFSRN